MSLPPTYWDDVETALTFARGQVYSESTSEMVERALKAFDRLKAVVLEEHASAGEAG